MILQEVNGVKLDSQEHSFLNWKDKIIYYSLYGTNQVKEELIENFNEDVWNLCQVDYNGAVLVFEVKDIHFDYNTNWFLIEGFNIVSLEYN
jgi:hypothetical protein